MTDNFWADEFAQGSTLQDGGDLYVLAIKDMPGKWLYGWGEEYHFEDCCAEIPDGTTFDVEWVKIRHPDPKGPLDSTGEGPDAKNPAILWQGRGAALFTRLEGAWYGSGRIYFVATDGGIAREGQIWSYDPSSETVTMEFESPDPEIVDGPVRHCKLHRRMLDMKLHGLTLYSVIFYVGQHCYCSLGRPSLV